MQGLGFKSSEFEAGKRLDDSLDPHGGRGELTPLCVCTHTHLYTYKVNT